MPLGIVSRRAGDYVTALGHFQRAAAVFSRAELPDLAARALLNAANVQDDSGDRDGAIATDRRIAAEFRDPTVRYAASLDEALLEFDRGRYANARVAARRALELAKQDPSLVSLPDPVCTATAAIGRAEAYLNDDTMIPRMRVCASAATRRGEAAQVSEQAVALADALNALARPREALPWLAIALRDAKDRTPSGQANLYRLAARVHAGVGEYDTALNYAEQAYQTMRTVADTARGAAVTAAVARSAVVEREAALELTRTRAALDAERAQARLVQTRVILSGILGAVILLGVIGFSRFRLVQARRRDNAVTEERMRVARDLHDTALQGFMAVTMQLQVAARTAAREDAAALPALLSALARDAGASLAQVRNAVWQMRSPVLASGDLRAAIVDWLESRRNDQAAIDIDLDGLPERLGQVKAEALLRVVQEAVNNAIIHGEASRIAVGTQSQNGKLVMTIVDNGKGFEPTDAAAMGGHWGLLGMRERIEALGGTLAIDSAPGRGTTITAIIPA